MASRLVEPVAPVDEGDPVEEEGGGEEGPQDQVLSMPASWEVKRRMCMAAST